MGRAIDRHRREIDRGKEVAPAVPMFIRAVLASRFGKSMCLRRGGSVGPITAVVGGHIGLGLYVNGQVYFCHTVRALTQLELQIKT